ncbi:M4 family metallopeptidase [Streptomyces antimicrobicus]|uniref:M4 family metallopeptidase n=1 Tax=Streptomyces antimicrobicus TaxID=2883108 RepID=A0ABS8AZV4_9ACTN|nr:M4 family metallopeptidase [Streptomyces antimicrobicus]MCB5177886.1 M4 family metallopeptidase [Streptomyces antimicrobicus]
MSPTPQRRVTAAGALVAAAALLAVGIQGGTASADATASQAATSARSNPGAAPYKLSASERATLLAEATGTTAQAARALGLGDQEKLVVRDVVKDADGTTHTTYERTYAGLPVLGGDLTVHAKDGVTRSVTKATNADIKVATTEASVAPAAAESQAVGAANAEGSKESKAQQGARKVIWAAEGAPVLAYETVVGGLQDDGTPSRLHVITDARTGAKITQWQSVQTGTGNTQYSGQVTIGSTQSGSTWNLTDASRGSHKTYNLNRGSSGTGTLFSGPDDVWGNGSPSNVETAGADAHYGAQVTWHYFKNVHGRNGLRNDGVAPYSRVHYGNAYVNAFWDDSCFCMTYGDGDGNNKPLTSIDVAAHEMTHGLTSVTGNMTYSGEPGGLNEATSDIMAAAVEFYANNPQDVGDYLVGEKIDIRGNGTPLRYMDKPSKDGSSKDAWYSGLGGIDVHYSSGPANHWFYLASEGSGAKVINGVSYDSPTSDGLPVTAIGREAAAKIWFRALTVGYFKSNTNYAAARTATLQAAADLYGAGSATYNNAANAWAAINVGSRVVQGVSVTNPGNQNTVTGSAVNLQIQASSTNPGALSYSATGLPTGLSINSSTGLISGTASTAGTYNVTVTVRDAANQTGTASFTWTVGTTQPNVFENTADYQIPDSGQVESPITVTRSGNAPSTLKVDVNIVHTYRGDLQIDLVAPDGTAYRLKNSSGSDSADNVVASYTVNASSEVANGVWKLRVKDVYAADTGYINSWKLTF